MAQLFKQYNVNNNSGRINIGLDCWAEISVTATQSTNLHNHTDNHGCGRSNIKPVFNPRDQINQWFNC